MATRVTRPLCTLEQSRVHLSVKPLSKLVWHTLDPLPLKMGSKDGMPLVEKLAELSSPIPSAIFAIHPLQKVHMRSIHAQLLSPLTDARIQAAGHVQMEERYCVLVDHEFISQLAVGKRILAVKQTRVRLSHSVAKEPVQVAESLKRVEKKVSKHRVEQRHAATRRELEKRCPLQTMQFRKTLRRKPTIMFCMHTTSETSDVNYGEKIRSLTDSQSEKASPKKPQNCSKHGSFPTWRELGLLVLSGASMNGRPGCPAAAAAFAAATTSG